MDYEQRTNKAFTLIELMVAIAILAMVLSFAGVIFKVGIDSYRMAMANAEIMQKFRAITDQLNADFKGLRKDGEIFVAWVAKEAVTANYDGYRDCDDDGYERFDRITFFANGDFYSYRASPKIIRGNTARICYMLARNIDGKRAEEYRDLSPNETGRILREEDRRNRILARTQHILAVDLSAIDPNGFNDNQQWFAWNNLNEHDTIIMEAWKNMPQKIKEDMLSVITDVKVGSPGVVPDESVWGTQVDLAEPNLIHLLLCEGVGEFKIQGWYDAGRRWVPEVDPDGDGKTSDSEFFLADPDAVPGVLYPYPPYGKVSLNGPAFQGRFFQNILNERDFNQIPGLGRALKFTFTLYDSKGIIKKGRVFTHIVYLDN